MKDNFERCLAFTLKQEGGYGDHPLDPGGATKFGVTQATLARFRGRAVSKADVRALTRQEAADIYRRDYWAPVAGDSLPVGIDAVVFDHAVNSGPTAALKTLRAALGLPLAAHVQGVVEACAKARSENLARELCRRRMSFLRALRTFATFGRGWTRRVEALEATALRMIREAGASRDGAPVPSTLEKGGSMTNETDATKPFWASQTIWSAIAAVGSSLAGAVLSWRAGDVSALGASLAAIAGGLGAIIGRVRATTPIG